MGNSTIPSIKRPNECDVITIFPLGVTCSVLQPSSDTSFDGAAALIITGGTPPYTVAWDSGSYAPALMNLGVGEYKATVTDYYNDFTAFTKCVLTAETTTFSGMCFVVSGVVEDTLVYISTSSLGLKNGKPYYQLQYGTTLIGYVFWSQAQNVWIFCESLDCQGSFYESLDNSGYLYPSGDTWTISGDTIYFIEESYPGDCNLPVIPKVNNPLCATLVIRSETPGVLTETIQIDLNPGLDINGQPSWSSVTNQYVIYWNTGSTPSQWTMTGYSNQSVLLINNDPSDPPISNWQVLGSPEVLSLDIIEGVCSSEYTISVSAVVNEAICGENGSIIVTASGGQAPYQYSIDGGLTYQPSPIFNGLMTGNYSIFVQDSNTTIGSTSATVTTSNQTTIYNFVLNINYSNGTFTVTAPPLPNGVTITFDLVHYSTFNYYPDTLSPAPTYNNTTTITGYGNMTLDNVQNTTVPLSGPCTADLPITILYENITYLNTFTLSGNETLNGSTTSSIVNSPIGDCVEASGNYQIYISNVSVNNCSCCEINTINPRPPFLI